MAREILRAQSMRRHLRWRTEVKRSFAPFVGITEITSSLCAQFSKFLTEGEISFPVAFSARPTARCIWWVAPIPTTFPSPGVRYRRRGAATWTAFVTG